MDNLTFEELQAMLTKANEENEMLANENTELKKTNEDLVAQIEKLAATPDAEETKNGVGEKFSYKDEEGKTAEYKIMGTRIRIPKLGSRTALEVLSDEEAQAWLVKNGSGFIKKMA